MAGNATKLVQRSQRLAFMDAGNGAESSFTRMTGFTSMTNGKNPKEYARTYVDETAERSDVVGYAPSTEYSFDRHTNTPVHEKITKIHDGELVGNDSHVDIITVDIFTEDAQKRCIARKRTYAVIPDTDGDGVDALIYSGSFKSVSPIEIGWATISEDGKTATYTKGDIPSQ